MSALLQAEQISFSYLPRRPVLREVSLALEAGEVVALIGPNGSGKSTLIKALLGHLRAAGQILWNDRKLRAWSRRELAKLVAYLPQMPVYEPEQRVIDVLRLGRAPYWRAFGLESPHDHQVLQKVIQQLHLLEFVDRRMDAISGGQRQLVFIGRALAQEPRAMLLDEPNTFLDLRHQVELCKTLQGLARRQSLGILMASHDVNLASLFADRLILLDQGVVAAAGAPSDVLQPQLLTRVFGVPIERIDRGNTPLILPSVNLG